MQQMAKKLQGLIARTTNMVARLEQYMGCTLQEILILTYMRDNGFDKENNIYAVDIQKKMHISRSSVSVIISGLVTEGYLVRQFDERNRKKTLLIITKKGEEQLDHVNEKFKGYIAQVRRQFNEEKFHQFIDLADEFIDVSNHQLAQVREKINENEY